MSSVVIRNAARSDLPAVAMLLERYMAESLARAWEGTVQALARDIAAKRVRFAIADTHGVAIAFASWHPTYDVHHCAAGGEISDLFVLPGSRGRGLAPRLVAHVAREVQVSGGRFVKGRGTDAGGGLSNRIAVVCDGGECYVGGGAFRTLAELAEAAPKAFASRLPNREQNFEQ
jgi:GNAT superfamily N-acetyltransferase